MKLLGDMSTHYSANKVCMDCHRSLPLAQFYINRGQRVAHCRACNSLRRLRRLRQSVISTWTPERVEMLSRLFEEGLSASEIGRRMGVTKNTVIGKLHRSGMTRRETWSKFVPQRNLFESGGLGCLWPSGNPDDPHFHFCGGHPLPGKPYCAAHAAIAYVRPKEERQAASLTDMAV